MSGRPKKIRNISFAPTVLGFKPYGESKSLSKKEPVFLHYEEYEALRLCDYEKRTQLQAASLMNISRPTLTRIYSSARKKIATGFIEGRQIIVEGGKVSFDQDWHICPSCGTHFTYPFKNGEATYQCPLCRSSLAIAPEIKKIKAIKPGLSIADNSKVAITSVGNTLTSTLDDHFGRCSYFAILDTQTYQVDFIKNPYKSLDQKTGILASKLMETHQVKKIISGNFGIKVKPLLTEAQIQLVIIKKNNVAIQDIVKLLGYENNGG